MTLTSRLFFAIEISQTSRETITNRIKQFNQKNTVQKNHWIPPQNWHLTICFLGEIPNERISVCLAVVKKSLETLNPFEFTLGKLSVFPKTHPRMLVIQIPPSEALIALHDTMKDALISAGFKQEKRTFFPHITLAKFSPNLSFSMDEIIIPSTQRQQVKEVVLFSSKAGAEGSIYTVVQRLVL